METGLPQIITQSELRRHNIRCVARSLLFFVGAGAIVLVTMILGWCFWGVITGEMTLTTLSWKGLLFMSLFALVVFRWGNRRLKVGETSIWQRFETQEGVDPGVRISRKMEQGLAGIGGLSVYLMLAPRWLRRGLHEWQSMIPAQEETASALEDVRRHLAARETWEPVSEFSHHEDALQDLAKLEMVSLKEHLDQWYVRVALAGQTKHDLREAVGVEEV